jgi:CRISPR/Cas system-associated exonuclease Cas4 (RecB family)
MSGHFSASQVTSWLYCGKSFELERIKRVPQEPAWFLIGGSAFHKATEWLDCVGHQTSVELDELWEDCIADQIKEALEKQPDHTKWRVAGVTKDRPEGQNLDWWMDNGPEMLRNYVQWGHGDLGLPLSTEEEFHVHFGEIEAKGFIDRVYAEDIVDLKTGTKAASVFQLGIYHAALLVKHGYAPRWGRTFSARDGKLSRRVDLSLWTPEYAGKVLANLERAIEAEVFIPQPSFSCQNCSVRVGCFTAGGELSQLYDSLDPNFNPDN